jgi:aspartyl-tRNA(Asn)/glutamyl-tRNA(Gln) amidotransferase subunit C
MINIQELKKISRLSRIKMLDNEVDAFVTKLQSVMKMINTLQEVNTDGVEPLTSAVRAHLYTREDKVTDGDIVEELFVNVPGASSSLAREIKCFVVPKVVE